jgi:succinate-semialdehyde dehydrogenase/glutarate-semialdehyde dehydrogenase
MPYVGTDWLSGSLLPTRDVLNPATAEVLAKLSCVSHDQLAVALETAADSFAAWREAPALERSHVLRGAAARLRERVESLAMVMTLEQGKPLEESRAEVMTSADILDWAAEEGRRAYGRIVPSRSRLVRLSVEPQPVGPVVAMTPWNFPMLTPAQKLAPALAAGCSVVIKASEETPGSAAALLASLLDAGLPPGTVQLVFGEPDAIARQAIESRHVRKLTFTGSTAVGRHLLGLAARNVLRTSMELGGHAPVLVLAPFTLERLVPLLVQSKFRNAGQICIAPSRFYVSGGRAGEFARAMADAAAALRVGDGMDPAVQMGPLANARRVVALQSLVDDAVAHGAVLLTGGRPRPGAGFFFEPTVLADVPAVARIMREEPFGPVVAVAAVPGSREAITHANDLPFGLAGYVFSDDAALAQRAARALEVGMVAVNHVQVALPETPFGGVKHSGFGSEGGVEGLAAYLAPKALSEWQAEGWR